jgi:hypothetical protein
VSATTNALHPKGKRINAAVIGFLPLQGVMTVYFYPQGAALGCKLLAFQAVFKVTIV